MKHKQTTKICITKPGQHTHLLPNSYRYWRYSGTWNHWAVELLQQIGRQATLITGEPRESTFLFQQFSVALRRENAVAFLNTFDSV